MISYNRYKKIKFFQNIKNILPQNAPSCYTQRFLYVGVLLTSEKFLCICVQNSLYNKILSMYFLGFLGCEQYLLYLCCRDLSKSYSYLLKYISDQVGNPAWSKGFIVSPTLYTPLVPPFTRPQSHPLNAPSLKFPSKPS